MKNKTLNYLHTKACFILRVMQRFGLLFHFQIHFLSVWLNQYMSFGFSILTFDNCNIDRSLLGIFWQQQDRRLWISILFINYRFYF